MVKLIQEKDIELPFEPFGFYLQGSNIYLVMDQMSQLTKRVHELVGENLWKTTLCPSCKLDGKAYASKGDMIFQINGGDVRFYDVQKPREFWERSNPEITCIDTDGTHLYVRYEDNYEDGLGVIVLKDMKPVNFLDPGDMLSEGSDGYRFFQVKGGQIEIYRKGSLERRVPANLEQLSEEDIGLVGIVSDGQNLYRLTRGDKESPVTMRPFDASDELHVFRGYPAWDHVKGYLVTLNKAGIQIFEKGRLVEKIEQSIDLSKEPKKAYREIMTNAGKIFVLVENRIQQWHLKDE